MRPLRPRVRTLIVVVATMAAILAPVPLQRRFFAFRSLSPPIWIIGNVSAVLLTSFGFTVFAVEQLKARGKVVNPARTAWVWLVSFSLAKVLWGIIFLIMLNNQM